MSKALCSALLSPRGEPHFSLRRPPQDPPPAEGRINTLLATFWKRGRRSGGSPSYPALFPAPSRRPRHRFRLCCCTEDFRKDAEGSPRHGKPGPALSPGSPSSASERLLGEQKGKNLGKSPGHCSGTQSQQLCWDPSRHRGLEGAQDAAPSCPRIVTGAWQGDSEKIHRFGCFVEKRVTKK